MRTSLHAALGDPGLELNFDLLVRACAEHIEERDDIDWKSELPLTASTQDGKTAQQLELAKDIAAMANTGGGTIVFGIAEVSKAGSTAAGEIVSVGEVSDMELRRIRQVAANLVYPPVMALGLHVVREEGIDGRSVLVLVVPDSIETPHLVRPKGSDFWFGAPWRNGPDTAWMVERQIAAAYRARELGRRNAEVSFDAQFDGFVDRCADSEPWVLAFAAPDARTTSSQPLTKKQADQAFETVWTHPFTAQHWGPATLLRDAMTQTGLRSFYRYTSHQPTGAMGPVRARAEIHRDGSVGIAFSRAGFLNPSEISPGQVAIPDLETVGAELFALVSVAAAWFGTVGDYMARLDVRPRTQVFRSADPTLRDAYRPFDEDKRVRAWQAVTGSMLLSLGTEEGLRSWFDTVSDAVMQTGWSPSTNVDDLVRRLTD